MKDHSLSNPNAKPEQTKVVPKDVLATVDALNEAQMMNLRHHLDMQLKIEVSQMNLTEELGLQYRRGKALFESVDERTPVNQRAQVLNSIQANLDKIVKQRTLVFSQERLKRFEAAMLKVLELKGNEKEQELFLELYGSFLRDRGQ